MSNLSLNDPLDAFLQSHGEVESKISCTISSREAGQRRHALLWRQDPEESLSDWKIILVSDAASTDDCSEKDSIVDENQSDNARNEEHANDGEKNDSVSAKCVVYDDDNESGDDEDDHPTTTFHVHRNILASVSKYFQSLFRKLKHSQTNERQSQTSIINLHPVAIKAFPVFLDYVYSWPLGKLGFRRSNAVALRHLAFYFGVDTLMKDISELILLDFRSARFKTFYYNNAILFKDEKLLQGISLQSSIRKTLLAVAPGIFSKPSNDALVLSSWRHIVMHLCDFPSNAFFTFKNAEKYSDITVMNAGLDQVNGIYKLYGRQDGAGAYTNGIFSIIKSCGIWRIFSGYWNDEGQWNMIQIYIITSDSNFPPSTGWKIVLGFEEYSPAPTILSLNS